MRKISGQSYLFDSLPVDRWPVLLPTEPENPALLDCRHHIGNYVALLLEAMGSIYNTLPATAGQNSAAIELVLNRGDVVGTSLGLTEQMIADAMGSTNPSTGLLSFVETEVAKQSGGLIGGLVVLLLDNVLQNTFLPTFELKRIGKYDINGEPEVELDADGNPTNQQGDGLARILLGLVLNGQMTITEYLEAMDVYMAIEDAIETALTAEFPGLTFPLVQPGETSSGFTIRVDGPLTITLPAEFSDLVSFTYPTGNTDLTVRVTIPSISLGADARVRLMEVSPDGSETERGRIVTEKVDDVRITGLQARLKLPAARLANERQDGWPTHRFTLGDWSEFEVSISADEIEVALDEFKELLGLAIGTALLGIPDITAILGALGIVGDDLTEDGLVELLRTGLEGPEFLPAALSGLGVKIPAALTQAHAAELVALRYPFNGSAEATEVSFRDVEVETRRGAQRFFKERPEEQEQSDVTLPGNPKLPDLDDISLPLAGVITGEWPDIVARLKGDKTAGDPAEFIAEQLEQNKQLSALEKALALMHFEGVPVADLRRLSAGVIDSKAGTFLTHDLSPASLRLVQAYFKTEATGAKKGTTRVKLTDEGIRASLVRAQFAVHQEITRRLELDTERAPVQIRGALAGVFECENAATSPLGGRRGSFADPAQIELSCNCVPGGALLKLMNAGGRLAGSGSADVPGIGEVAYTVSEIGDVAADFNPGGIVAGRDFATQPAIAVRDMAGSYKDPVSGDTVPFQITARIRCWPGYLDDGDLPDDAVRTVVDNLGTLQNMMNGQIEDGVRVRELLFRRFVYLLRWDPDDDSGVRPVVPVVGDNIQFFGADLPEGEGLDILAAIAGDWLYSRLPLPLLYDPWNRLGDRLFDVSCTRGWIEMRKIYGMGDLASAL